MTWADQILAYHFDLKTDIRLPHGVDWLYPYSDEETRRCMRAFYGKYFNDSRKRALVLGINPGRFGAGITGVPFTDPIRLETECGVSNGFDKRAELSSAFVYDVIGALGGPRAFYRKYYISALCPFGFIRDKKNFNYYDDKELMQRIEPFITQHIVAQIGFGADHRRAFCLGQGKNYQYLVKLNAQHGFFTEIVPLPHPRWVMQYRLRKKAEFVQQYVDVLQTPSRP